MQIPKFSKINLDRCTKGFKHSLEDWSIAEWTNAMCGEAGEAANIAKKIIRLRSNVDGIQRMNKGEEYSNLVLKLGQELADVVIYADLCAQRIGTPLETSIIHTFNNKSKDLGLGNEYLLTKS